MHHDEAVRYARQISLSEIGKNGQLRLRSARVLIIGAGGLGSPLLLYLAAAGIGTIGVIDPDRVALSNLQRQILHETTDVGRLKVESAVDAAHDINPDVHLIPYAYPLDAHNCDTLVAQYDLVADGCDSPETRLLVNASCLRHRKTLVSAAVMGFSGHLYTFKPYLGAPHPCYQCLYPTLSPSDALPRCAEAGILGSVAGQLGTWQATEVIKELLYIGNSLSGHMIIVDALAAAVRKIALPRDPHCPCCGDAHASSGTASSASV